MAVSLPAIRNRKSAGKQSYSSCVGEIYGTALKYGRVECQIRVHMHLTLLENAVSPDDGGGNKITMQDCGSPWAIIW